MTPEEKSFKLKRYNIISDWLDRYGDPAIDEKVEKQLKKISNMKQTAVDSLIKSILPFIDRSKVSDMMLQDIVAEHLAMEKERMINFAKYCLNNAKHLNFEKALFNVEEYYQIFKSK